MEAIDKAKSKDKFLPITTDKVIKTRIGVCGLALKKFYYIRC
jgi:hypothetical protein